MIYLPTRPELVLGSGPTAVFAAAAASPPQGRLLVSRLPAGMLTPVASGDLAAPITIVPIFPPDQPTRLAQLLADFGAPIPGLSEPAGHLQIEYLFEPASSKADPKRARALLESTGPFRQQAELAGARTLVLAAKQYGEPLLDRPLALLRHKILRSYYQTEPRPPAVGYQHGESPYALAQRAILPRLDRVIAEPVRLDGKRRQLILDDGSTRNYQRIIFTGNLLKLASLLGLPEPELVTAPAHFIWGSAEAELAASSIRYDLRADSPILRTACPTRHAWVAQLSQSSYHEVRRAGTSQLVPWISSILGVPVSEPSGLISHAGAYPLESISAGFAAELAARCADAGVLPFGRYAEWRYLDLHELDWDRVSLSC